MGEEIDGSDNVDEFDVGMDGDDGVNEVMEWVKEKNKEIVSRFMEEFKE